MPAYLIARVKVQDHEGYKAYALKSKPSIDAFGGKILTRGGVTEVLEGEDSSNRVVLVEFKDMATAKAWYNSDKYQEARLLRTPVSNATFMIIEST